MPLERMLEISLEQYNYRSPRLFLAHSYFLYTGNYVRKSVPEEHHECMAKRFFVIENIIIINGSSRKTSECKLMYDGIRIPFPSL